MHVVTTRANDVNTDPATPRDYQAATLTWVRARLADPSSSVGRPRKRAGTVSPIPGT